MSDEEKKEETKQADGETPDTEAGKTSEVKSEKTSEVKEAEEKKPEPSSKFKKLIGEIEQLSVLELAELVKELEGRFGVSAAPMAVAAAPATGGEAQPAEEGKSRLTVWLTESGGQKINVIKAVREINQQLGLKEAKDLVDNPPKEVAKDLPKEEAEAAKKKLEAAGAKAELR